MEHSQIGMCRRGGGGVSVFPVWMCYSHIRCWAFPFWTAAGSGRFSVSNSRSQRTTRHSRKQRQNNKMQYARCAAMAVYAALLYAPPPPPHFCKVCVMHSRAWPHAASARQYIGGSISPGGGCVREGVRVRACGVGPRVSAS